MDNSIFLAKFLGIFFTIIALGFIINRAHIKQAVAALSENAALQLIATLLPILFGSLLIAAHNEWSLNWSLLITIIGWLMLLVGIMRGIFTNFWLAQVNAHKEKFASGSVGGGLLILGVILLYYGYHIG